MAAIERITGGRHHCCLAACHSEFVNLTMPATKLKALERENRELRQANEILRKASAYFDGVDAPSRRHISV